MLDSIEFIEETINKYSVYASTCHSISHGLF